MLSRWDGEAPESAVRERHVLRMGDVFAHLARDDSAAIQAFAGIAEPHVMTEHPRAAHALAMRARHFGEERVALQSREPLRRTGKGHHLDQHQLGVVTPPEASSPGATRGGGASGGRPPRIPAPREPAVAPDLRRAPAPRSRSPGDRG